MRKLQKQDLVNRIEELEDIPLADVHGGRQRTSQENEELIKKKIVLERLEDASKSS